MLTEVISGGQTGIDQMGLWVAREVGIPTGGTAPPKFYTETGSNWDLRDIYGLKEAPAGTGYPYRTEKNVIDSDGTVLFGDMTSQGSFNTIQECERHSKPYIANPTDENLVKWIQEFEVEVLNVAGNRGSKCDVIMLSNARDTLRSAFKKCIRNAKSKSETIKSKVDDEERIR